ncbi:MAG TPA: M24 family metallopeptidase [Bacillota bacterium]|nr:M24 family metallopeptidase [Bacillota bacterium]
MYCPAGSSNWQDKILPLRQRARVTDTWLAERLSTVLPKIMKREGFDMWIVAAREYNEDPVFDSLVPATMLSARRLTMLIFILKADGSVETLNLARYGFGAYRAAWEPEREDQWQALVRIIREHNPGTIGINVSETFAFGDGLSHGLYEQMWQVMPTEYRSRFKGAERLCLAWLETRTPQEMDAYTGIVEIAHGIIREAFSGRFVHPGITTCEDISWWIRQRIHDLGLDAWFHPGVSAQRRGTGQIGTNVPVAPGDLLWCDVGLVYLGLCTDTQQNAYILRIGETTAPAGLREALSAGNRVQDIHAANMHSGRTGNEILAAILKQTSKEELEATVYTHPLGYHGHGAGTTIGLWDMQGGVPGRGDYELFDDTCHSMELNVKHPVPEWEGQKVQMAVEQDILFTGGKAYFLAGRQTELFLI